MSLHQNNIETIDDKIEKSVNAFIEGVEKSQKGIFNKLLAIVKEVELSKTGEIKQTVRNLKLLARIRKTIESEILTQSYINKVNTFSNQFTAIASLNNGYFKVIEKSFDPNRELYKEVIKNSISLTKNSLLGAGIDENIIKPVTDIVNDSVTSGAAYNDMIDSLRVQILGDEKRLGTLMRYSQQITTDAMNQFNGSYNETIAKDLDLEWYYYSGGLRSTSRSFCRKHAQKYFHKKQIESFADDKWEGKAKGTTKSSIFKYRGGYNCKHVFKPTLIDAVPKKYIEEAKKKGYYK